MTTFLLFTVTILFLLWLESKGIELDACNSQLEPRDHKQTAMLESWDTMQQILSALQVPRRESWRQYRLSLCPDPADNGDSHRGRVDSSSRTWTPIPLVYVAYQAIEQQLVKDRRQTDSLSVTSKGRLEAGLSHI
jgi:hypothetical protein